MTVLHTARLVLRPWRETDLAAYASLNADVEAGWRLDRAHWGRGYATEAARAALDQGFGALELPEVVASAVSGNVASRRVMERLGMSYDPADDFDYSGMSEGDPLRRHVLYRATREQSPGG